VSALRALAPTDPRGQCVRLPPERRRDQGVAHGAAPLPRKDQAGGQGGGQAGAAAADGGGLSLA